MNRLQGDREKLLEAVDVFRVRANLHAGSSDSALVGWAHGNGKRKPYADMVRDAWHDFAAGRRYAELSLVEYVIDYARRDSEDGDPVAPVDEAVGDRPGGSDSGSPSVRASESVEHPALTSPRARKRTPKREPKAEEDGDVLF